MTIVSDLIAARALHTPGPWAVNPFAAQVDAFNENGGAPVCELLWPTKVRSEAETAANANLIAAAPDLLEALREANALLLAPAEDIKGGVMSRIRAAISKALGEPQPKTGDDRGRSMTTTTEERAIAGRARAELHVFERISRGMALELIEALEAAALRNRPRQHNPGGAQGGCPQVVRDDPVRSEARGRRDDHSNYGQGCKMNGFHTQKNLFFSRQPDGSVEITKYRDDMPWSAGGPSEEPLFRQVVDADSWCSVIASMSAGGEADLRFFAAQTFHRSAGAISIQREHPPTGGSNG